MDNQRKNIGSLWSWTLGSFAWTFPRRDKVFHKKRFPLENIWYYHLKWRNLNKWGGHTANIQPDLPEGLSLFEFFTQFIPTLSGAFSDSSHNISSQKFPVPWTHIMLFAGEITIGGNRNAFWEPICMHSNLLQLWWIYNITRGCKPVTEIKKSVRRGIA